MSTHFLRLLALGASDVVGHSLPDPARDAWPVVLTKLLPGPPRLKRMGLSGARAADLRARFLAAAIADRPDLAVVWTGVNDCIQQVPLPAFRADFDALVGGLRGAGTEVWVVNLPDVERLPAFQAWSAMLGPIVRAWQVAVREVAAAHGARVIELAPHTLELADTPDLLGPDGFHPSAAGHRRLAAIFAVAIAAR